MLNNLQAMLTQFEQFRNTYQGNPKAEVEKLMQSGQISQAQINQVQNIASMMMRYMKP